MSEFIEHIPVFARVKFCLILSVEVLDCHEQVLEIESRCGDFVDIDRESSHQGLVALGILAHGAVVDRIPVVAVGLSENLAVFIHNFAGI